MRRIILIATIFITGSFAGMSTPRPAHAQDGDAAWMLTQINNLRQSKGIPALSYNALLASAANAHSQYLASNPWSDPHTETNGSTPRSRALAAGYPVAYVGENVVGGSNATKEWAFNWWLNSPIHYQNMLGKYYLEVGIGVADGSYGRYYTLLFGAADGSNPAPAAQVQAPAQSQAQSQPNPAAANQAVKAPPTRVPTRRPTLTPTNTLTPTITYTPRATFTPTYTATPAPATGTAIVLEVSPQPTSGPQMVAMMTTPEQPNPQPSASSKPDAPHSNDPLRTLIPLALAIQVLVIGGAVVRGVLQRRKTSR